MNAPWPIPLHPDAPPACNPFLQKVELVAEKEARVPKEVAKAIALRPCSALPWQPCSNLGSLTRRPF